jgi:O-antigen ligase
VNILNMFGDPNSMALHLVMMIPVAAALFLSTPNVIKKAVYGGGALLMMAGTFATLSRGGFLALVGAGGVMAWKLSRRHRLVVVFCFVITVGAAFMLAPGNYGNRLVTIVDHSRDMVGSASARQAVLYRSIAVALRSPLLGVGVGNFPIVSLNNSVTHNAYTQIAAEVGLPALLMYVLFMASAYKRLRRIEQETLGQRRPRFYHLAVGLQAGLVGYAIGSFFLSVAYEFYVYSFVGYALCLHRLYETGAGQPGSAGRGRQEGTDGGEGTATTLVPQAWARGD